MMGNHRDRPTPPELPAALDGRQLDEIRLWQQQLATVLVRLSAAIGLVAVVFGYFAAQPRSLFWLYLACYLVLVVIAFWKGVSHGIRTTATLVLLYGLGVLALLEDGLSGDGRVFLLFLPVLASLLLDWRAGAVSLALAVLTLGVFAGLFSYGALTPPEQVQSYSADWIAWASGSAVFFLLGVLAIVTQGYVLPRASRLIVQHKLFEQDQARQIEALQETQAVLRQRIQAQQLIIEASQAASSSLKVDELLQRTVETIEGQLQCGFVGIYVVDETRSWAELKAATGKGGKLMLERKFRLNLILDAVLGKVARDGEACLFREGEPGVSFPTNPELPETRTEAAFPMRVRGEVMGLLDLQSRALDAFDDETFGALQRLADQLAMIVHNIRSLEATVARMRGGAGMPGEVGGQTWQDFIRSRPIAGYRYSESGIMPLAMLGERPEPSLGDADSNGRSLRLPLRMRREVVATITANKPEGAGVWTEEERSLLQTLIDQLAVALEGARLYEETQRHALREQQAGQIVSLMRETLDIDAILKTAVSQLGQALGDVEVAVCLSPESENIGNGQL